MGYGDVSPDTDGGKVFCIFYTIIGCTFAATGFRSLVREFERASANTSYNKLTYPLLTIQVFYPVILKQKQKEMKITAQFGDELSEVSLGVLALYLYCI